MAGYNIAYIEPGRIEASSENAFSAEANTKNQLQVYPHCTEFIWTRKDLLNSKQVQFQKTLSM